MLPDCFWSLYNTTDEIRVDGLRTLQIQALLRCLARSSIQEWLVWQEGTSNWTHASEILERIDGYKASHRLPPTPPPVNSKTQGPFIDLRDATNVFPPSGKTDGSEEDDAPSGAASNLPSDQRTTPRFELQLKAFINFNGRMIPNETANISVGGLKFRDPLPNEIENVFDVTLMNQGIELVLRCHGIQAKDEPTLTRAMIQSCNRMDILRMWIVSGPQMTTSSLDKKAVSGDDSSS